MNNLSSRLFHDFIIGSGRQHINDSIPDHINYYHGDKTANHQRYIHQPQHRENSFDCQKSRPLIFLLGVLVVFVALSYIDNYINKKIAPLTVQSDEC